MVYATELPGILYRHHLLDILYHANQGMVTAGVGANRANLIITYIMADLAVLHVSTEVNQGRGEVFPTPGKEANSFTAFSNKAEGYL